MDCHKDDLNKTKKQGRATWERAEAVTENLVKAEAHLNQALVHLKEAEDYMKKTVYLNSVEYIHASGGAKSVTSKEVGTTSVECGTSLGQLARAAVGSGKKLDEIGGKLRTAGKELMKANMRND